jgi:hypothetical protein
MFQLDYLSVQIGEALLCALGAYFSWTSFRGRLPKRIPLALVVLYGYWFACIGSNFLRWAFGQWTALAVIDDGEYLFGATVWCVIMGIFTYAYLAATPFGDDVRAKPRPLVFPSEKRTLSRKAIAYCILVFGFGLTIYFLNPFRTVDFNLLTPSSVEEIVMGGLMISSVATMIAAAPVAGILLHRPLLGFLAVGTVTWLLANSGSKAIGAVFSGYMAALAFRNRRSMKLTAASWFLIPILLVGSVAAFRYAQTVRAGPSDDPVSLADSVGAAVVRFTQHDVFVVLWANPDFTASIRSNYVLAQITGFIPGFLWPDKPPNPAYEINDFCAFGNTSAASVSVFGTLLIAAGRPWLFLLTAILGVYACRFDQFLQRSRDFGILEWNHFYMLVSIFETVYVLAVPAFILTFLIRRIGSAQRTHRSVRRPLLLSPNCALPSGKQ